MGETGTATEPTAQAPPVWIVALALGAGAVLVFGTTYGGHLLISAASNSPAPAVLTSPPPTVPQSPQREPGNDWRAALTGTPCALPCAAGIACPANPKECTSGLACIPGTGRESFDPGETWMIHLSAVREVAPPGTVIDPCVTRRDFWVCRSGTTTCVSQKDACAHSGKSSHAIPVTGAELAANAVVLEVREGGPSTAKIAETLPIQNLVRGGLCNGFGRDAVGGGIGRVTYFLLPP